VGCIASQMAAAAAQPSSSARARAPLPAASAARPLHPLAGLEEGEAVAAAAHPGAHRVRRRGRKQKQVRERSLLIS